MGEEIMLSSRFFTNGYDIFAPRENILAHEYVWLLYLFYLDLATVAP
jgi:hypothetical protein